MKISTNFGVQILGIILQLVNSYGAMVPAKYQFWVTGIVGIAQGISAIVSHYSNPDGTKAALPYVK